ncbi:MULTISPECIES: VOC family protein [Xanthomonas]|uniref:Glyoxalase n=1 Tax=Xanthomonas cannabis pv. phaseoli TaxID=1885902 RepID=A0AB34P6Y9_9XANT|nr:MULTISPECIES: VOC family protein [Xanthomonas]KGK56988.1 glyoxalase [Xanthomonas cannabis pv. phaseoli]MBB3802189.1 catechol 2,3-dioxygenase-like lactoylglutathione lyase family enzyme [Xanthomonas cannabis]NIK02896.1 catechol 2,3-dioxygenase-like lactoylglutathione lyase family enzyme [Xanthomonas cannabis]NIK66225.1 catechol 2,3-dioxygenase-like lactoylglutathione lyase family enzyme [Xanthomonas cannabis]PPU29822.1 VOC family protein [Xanthomonas sp. CFBP 7912]
MSGIDHVGIACGDLAASVAFYRAALAPLGMTLLAELSAAQTGSRAHAGFGIERAIVWLGSDAQAPGTAHLALAAADRASVDAFHRAALAAGGRDHGAPGLRPHYHPHYYSAFVLDPDGNNLEAVCHRAA